MAKLFEIEGPVDDLLNVSPDGTMKCANLVYLGPDKMDAESEIFHFAITSTAMNAKHDIFDKMLGKRIKVTVEMTEDETTEKDNDKGDEKQYKENIDNIFSKHTVNGVLTPTLDMCKELADNDIQYHPEKLGVDTSIISTMISDTVVYNRIRDTYAMGLAKGMLSVIKGKED